jgi:arylsulfatase A-like enzyme
VSGARLRRIALSIYTLMMFGCREGSGPDVYAARPNVVLYVVDTLRADALAVYGNPRVDTPSVDRLAAEGVLYENAYAPSSWTRSSVASLLTGVLPGALGVESRDDQLPTSAFLLSEAFSREGYATAAFVANPNVGSFFGFKQGFGDFVELYVRDAGGRVRSRELITGSDVVGERAIEWLARAPQPFFLFVLSIDPHSPYAPPEAFDRYSSDAPAEIDGELASLDRTGLTPEQRDRIRSLYLGEVAFNDHSLGRLLGELQSRGLWDRTIVAFTSDHGEEFWEHGERGHGKALYEESLRVPLVVRDPNARGGARITRPVSISDLFPTLLSLAGLPVPQGLDGRRLMGEGDGHAGPLVATLDLRGRNLAAIGVHPWKLILDRAGGETQLYHLDDDPVEAHDLSDEHPERRMELVQLLRDRLASDATRRAELGRDDEGPKHRELSEESLRALEALGYVEGDGGAS